MANQVCVIGLGRFGSKLATTLFQSQHEVLAIDQDDLKVQAMLGRVTYAVEADATSETVLRDLGVADMDVAVVALGQSDPVQHHHDHVAQNHGPTLRHCPRHRYPARGDPAPGWSRQSDLSRRGSRHTRRQPGPHSQFHRLHRNPPRPTGSTSCAHRSICGDAACATWGWEATTTTALSRW